MRVGAYDTREDFPSPPSSLDAAVVAAATDDAFIFPIETVCAR